MSARAVWRALAAVGLACCVAWPVAAARAEKERPASRDLQGAPKDLAGRIDALEKKAEALERGLLPHRLRVPNLTVSDPVKLRITGYADFGFFAPSGDGVAYVRDNAKRMSPQSSASRGCSTATRGRTPSTRRGSRPTSASTAPTSRASTRCARAASRRSSSTWSTSGSRRASPTSCSSETSLNFEPRQGTLGSPGDYVWVDLAYLEWRPSSRVDLGIFLGRFEPVFGIEYRRRKAPDRFEVTPSIISRYTIGTPTGVKVRGSAGPLSYAFSVTNGGSSTEEFAHFYNELDRNDFKTVAGRVALGGKVGKRVPVLIEAGCSALYGAQDLQADESVRQWQWGVDFRLEVRDFALRAEYLEAHADGGGLADAPSSSRRGSTPR